MKTVKFIQNKDHKTYSDREASNIEMLILGQFFVGNFSCSSSLYSWAIKAVDGDAVSGNSIRLEVEQDDILVKDLYSEEKIPTILRMKKKQFIKLCDDWMEAVCNVSVRPKELAIIYENDKYRVEVKKEQSCLNAFMHRWFY